VHGNGLPTHFPITNQRLKNYTLERFFDRIFSHALDYATQQRPLVSRSVQLRTLSGFNIASILITRRSQHVRTQISPSFPPPSSQAMF
jgi:hypothetical protein